MSILDRLDRWKQQDLITAQQHALFTGIVREEPFSLFAELNILLYAGVVAFVGGLGWTVTTFSRQIGDVLVVALLTAIVAGCLWYCFKRVPAWSLERTPTEGFLSDYVLYLCCLVWGIELAYLEQRLSLFPGHWDVYLLATAVFFFFLAYRFDNRLVLSLALSSLGGWFGFTIAKLSFGLSSEAYRSEALAFCLCVGVVAGALQLFRIKPHFFGTYLNLLANVVFISVLSGVFEPENSGLWFVALLLAGGASLAWGLWKREFAFVAYATVYSYIGIAAQLSRATSDFGGTLIFLIVTAIPVLIGLIIVSRNFGSTR